MCWFPLLTALIVLAASAVGAASTAGFSSAPLASRAVLPEWNTSSSGIHPRAFAAAGRQVFMGAHGGDVRQALYALDSPNGIVDWKAHTVTGSQSASPEPFVCNAPGSEMLVFARLDEMEGSAVAAFNRSIGKLVWRRHVNTSFTAGAPVVCSRETLVIGLPVMMYGLHPSTGEVRWSRAVDAWQSLFQMFEIDCEDAGGSSATCIAYSDDAAIWVVDVDSGQTRHRFAPPSADLWLNAVLYRRLLIFGEYDATVATLWNGTQVWSFNSTYNFQWGSADVVILQQSQNATAVGVAARSGEQLWVADLNALLNLSSAINVYFTTGGCGLGGFPLVPMVTYWNNNSSGFAALDALTGRVAWHIVNATVSEVGTFATNYVFFNENGAGECDSTTTVVNIWTGRSETFATGCDTANAIVEAATNVVVAGDTLIIGVEKF